MGNPFLNHIRGQVSSQNVRGKLISLIYQGEIRKILRMYTISSGFPNLPIIFLQTKDLNYLGITLARQSSDLLKEIAKFQLMEHLDENHLPKTDKILMEYRFPKEMTSLKLILLLKWTDLESFDMKIEFLNTFQTKFRDNLHKIAKCI